MDAVRKRTGPLHAVLIIGALVLFNTGLLPLVWPLHLLLPLLAYAIIVLAVPALRSSAPRLSAGRMNGLPLAAAAALCVATGGTLIAFHFWARPDVSGLNIRLPVSGLASLIVVGLCFSMLNALVEELIFRGIVWEGVATEWNATMALVVSAILFGVAHLHGYPSGPIGAVLAGLFGLALGLLRWWTGGLGLAVICHVVADATILGLILSPGVPGSATG
ncbi:MAG TPA: type II CAAX endopeptidase family protein [Gemmataceae bacterium]|jgi:hypothetical protein|nr:type II CAAX endopeptidase family protein [Gemmataceae bacterium]